ncbi:hypothetical protein [Leucobacter komagatae]|uniref:hypothetical protein n=1 Tax=Leucobacter komagatae TaxID=55969 RepID=UPI000698593C|nr:hypothetical protein [Leucobacter komagatae]
MLIAPANSAGQGFAWARALERVRPGTVVTSMQFVSEVEPYSFEVDQSVLRGFGAHSKAWQRAQFRAAIEYKAVLVESAMPPFGGMLRNDATQQIEALRNEGVRVGLLFHGSDIRDPELHLASEPLSYFAADPDFTLQMRNRVLRSRALINTVCAPLFVSTPDLLTELPSALWLPVVVDVEEWASGTAPPLSDSAIPVVLHIPSSSVVKGTALIEPVLRQLDKAGKIQYRSASGIPHAQVRDLVRGADIVVDQVRGGPYGVAACEAMAAGRVVVAHVPDIVRSRVAELTGSELPIVEAAPDTLIDVLEDLLEDRATARRIAGEGTQFVRHWHDGRESGRVLANWLDEGEAAETPTRAEIDGE